MAIKYKYALIGDGELIEIDSVLESDRQKKFTCIECEKQLIPALGNIRQPHFKHKVEANCSPESYLHKLAKLKFYEVYKNCLDNSIPFLINFAVDWNCNHYDWIPEALRCKKPHTETHNLTKYFPTINLEVPHGKFIPDILLRNPKGEAIYIEIKVSHGCTPEKINSGHGIIEIEIDCEKDIEGIINREITESPKVKFLNFTRNFVGDYCQGKCDSQTNHCAMLVDSNGVNNLLKGDAAEIDKAKSESSNFKYLTPDFYLRELAKVKFYEAYKNCLDTNSPFFINLLFRHKCNFHEGIPWLSCSEAIWEKYDLTKFFPIIEMEATHEGFTYDILLQSAKGTALYIEFKVSHSHTQDKINSGNRAIEITINHEKDIESFRMGELRQSFNVKFTNFIQERIDDRCQGKCNPNSDAFIVYPGGKSRLLTNSPLSDITNAKKSSIYFEWVNSDSKRDSVSHFMSDPDYLPNLYMGMNAKAFLSGVPVKNCFLCRYHSIDFYGSGAYCKFLKISNTSTFASQCQAFRPDPSVFSEYLEFLDSEPD